MTFTSRLRAAMNAHGPLCVGLDPHPNLLEQWGLSDSPAGLAAFSDQVVSAARGRAAALKPQVALFERHGSAGMAVLEHVLAASRAAHLLTITDAKRGDIGSTMAAYAQAYLTDGAPMASDAVTLSAYLGFGSLAPAIELAHSTGRGVFVLALTSNPEGAGVQHARDGDGVSVAGRIVAAANQINHAADEPTVGIVVGATIGSAADDLGIDLGAFSGPILAPGFGAQGADIHTVRSVFGAASGNVLVTSSRGILQVGPGVQALADEIDRVAGQVRALSRAGT